MNRKLAKINLQKESGVMYQNFAQYLQGRYGLREQDVLEDGMFDAVLPIGNHDQDRIVVFYPGGILSMSVMLGKIPKEERERVYQMVDDYNAQKGAAYEIRCLDDAFWVEIGKEVVDDQQAIDEIEAVQRYFARDAQDGWWAYVAGWMQEHGGVNNAV